MTESTSSRKTIPPSENDTLEHLLPPLSPLHSPSPDPLPIELEDTPNLTITTNETHMEGFGDTKEEQLASANAEADGKLTEDASDQCGTQKSGVAVDQMPEISAELRRQLFSQLIQYRGCCDDCHVKTQCEHSGRKMRHFGLKEYLNKIKTAVDYPDVLGSETLASREAKLARHVDEDSKRHIYYRIRGQGPDPEPAHICLDDEARETMVATTSFDIDSVIGFRTSLAMAKRGIR